MKKTPLWIAALVFVSGVATAQEQEFEKQLKYFNKVTISPKIHVVLTQGNTESIKLTYSNIDAARINVVVEGDKLKVYLNEARIVDKRERSEDYGKHSIYHNAQVTAHITFRDLRLLEIRGDQDVTINKVLGADHFLLRVYGEAEIRIDSLQTHSLKVVAYGSNKIKFNAGQAVKQRYVLYGENKVDSRSLEGSNISTNICGEGRLSVNATDEVKINSIGEPTVVIEGTSLINKGIMIGKTEIQHRAN